MNFFTFQIFTANKDFFQISEHVFSAFKYQFSNLQDYMEKIFSECLQSQQALETKHPESGFTTDYKKKIQMSTPPLRNV